MQTLKRVQIPLALLLALTAGAVQAQVNRQDNEIAASASLFQSLQGGPPQLTVGAHYGHLLKDFAPFGSKIDGVQVGGDALFTGALDFSGFASLTLFPQVRLYLNSKDPRFSPYVGVGLGVTIYNAGGASASLAYDVNGGVKYFLNPTTAAFVQLDLDGPVTSPSSSILIATAGLSLFF